MALYVIGDTHLSLGASKPMDVFGGAWEGYVDKLAEGFSGAEIEQAVIAALYEAFFAGRGLCREDLIKSIRETVSLSVTQKEQILSLRQWAATRAVLATAKEDREVLVDSGSGGTLPAQGGRIVDFDL